MPTPTLKRSWFFAGLDGNRTDTANNLKISLEASGTPRAVAVGDLVLVAVAFQNSVTCTISDDQTNTWTSAVSATNVGLTTPRKYQIFWASVASGKLMSTITVGFGAQTTNIQVAVSIWYNTATATPIDVSIGTTAIVPANNTAPNISSGSMTTTVAGDLIYNHIWDESNGTIGAPNTWNGVTWGTSFSGLGTEVYYGQAAQYWVQPSAGAINSGITVSQTTHDSFASLAIAIKAGSGGSAPGTGISIVKSQYAPIQSVATTTSVPFPTSGNLIVVANDAGTFGSSLTSITDSASQSYAAIASTPAGFPQLYHADNTSPSNTLVVNLVTTTVSGNDLVGMYDVIGAATSPLDTAAAAANSSTLTAAGSGATSNGGTQGAAGQAITDAPSIVPSTSNGLIFAAGNFGQGPVGSLSAPSGSYDYVPATWGGTAPTGDNNYLGNGDFMAHYHNPNTTTVNFGYAVPNTVASSWQALAAAFKAAPAPVGAGVYEMPVFWLG